MAGVTGEQDWYISGVFSMSFINLNDTFGDYIDRAGMVPKVNASEDALIPSDAEIDSHAVRHKDGGPDELDVADLGGAEGSNGQVPETDGAAVIWVNLAHGNLSNVGYNDHHSVGTGVIWDADNNVAHDVAAVHEAGGALEITHNNLAIVYNDHHGVGTGVIWDAGNNIAHDSPTVHEAGGALEITHNNLALNPNDHHAKYTDAEAISALEGNANVFTPRQEISRPEDNDFLWLKDSDTGNKIHFFLQSDGVFRILGYRSNDTSYFDFATFHPAAGYWSLESDAQVPQGALKTSTRSGSVDIGPESGGSLSILGTYGFTPQIWAESNDVDFQRFSYASLPSSPTNSKLLFYNDNYDQYLKAYAEQRYITASGEIHWIFIKRDRQTKHISAMWQAPDHPCFGDGGKPDLKQHPFPDFDPLSEEILVINMTPEDFEEMIGKYTEDEDGLKILDPLEVIEKYYDIDDSTEPPWPDIPITVGLPRRARVEVGRKVTPIKKQIPKPDIVRTARLRKLQEKQ